MTPAEPAPLSSRPVELIAKEAAVGQHAVLSLRGEIDLATLPQLHNALTRFVQTHVGETVVVDMDGVYACDDAGLGILLGASGRAREAGGELVIVCSDGPLRARLERTRFDRAVTVATSINDV